jgi:hypothetical protein
MKIFTLEEANNLIPTIEPILIRIRDLYARIGEMREAVRSAAAASQFGGGMEGGSGYVNDLYNLGKLTTELGELGVELKDYSRGLIDFPSLRNERVVHLCWQLGEEQEIAWWHETDGGFAGRQRL